MESKEKIVQQAISLFLSKGVEGLSLEKIATEVNTDITTLKENFTAVDELIKEAMDTFFMQAEKLIQNILNEDKNAIEKWLSINDEITKLIKIDDRHSTVSQLRIHYPKLFERAKCKQWEVIKTSFQSYLFQGMKEGLFHLDIDTDLFMRFYFLGLVSIEQTTLFDETNYTYSQIKEKYIEMQVRIVATEKGLAVLEKVLNID